MRLAKRSPWLTTAALLLLGAIICGALAFLTPLTASVGAANGGFTESLGSEEVVLDFVTTTTDSITPTYTTTTSCTNVKGVNTCSTKTGITTTTVTTKSTSCTNVKGVNTCSTKSTTTTTTTTTDTETTT